MSMRCSTSRPSWARRSTPRCVRRRWAVTGVSAYGAAGLGGVRAVDRRRRSAPPRRTPTGDGPRADPARPRRRPKGDDVFDMLGSQGLGPLRRARASTPRSCRSRRGRTPAVPRSWRSSTVPPSRTSRGGNPAYLAAIARRHAVLVGAAAGDGARTRLRGLQRGRRVPRRHGARQRPERFDDELWEPGLGVFPGFWFGPHWDALDGFVPGLTDFIVSSMPPGRR